MGPKKDKSANNGGPEPNIKQLKRKQKESKSTKQFQTKLHITPNEIEVSINEQQRSQMEKSKIISRLMQIETERAKIKVEESKCLKKIMKLISIHRQVEEEQKQLIEADYIRYFLADTVDYEVDLTDIMLSKVCTEVSLAEQGQHEKCQTQEQCSNVTLKQRQSREDIGIIFEEVKFSLDAFSIRKETESQLSLEEKYQ